MQSYIEGIYHIPHTLAQLVDCGIYDFPLIILTASLMRVLRTGPLPLSLYALDLSQLSNIAICQKRSRSFPATAICMRTRQHGVPTHSFVFTRLRHFHFHFPFWISIRIDSILNDFLLPPLNVRSVPAKCSTWDLSSVSIRNLFSVSFYIHKYSRLVADQIYWLLDFRDSSRTDWHLIISLYFMLYIPRHLNILAANIFQYVPYDTVR